MRSRGLVERGRGRADRQASDRPAGGAAPPTARALREEIRRAELELGLEELRHAKRLMARLTEASPVAEEDADAAQWVRVSHGAALDKEVAEIAGRPPFQSRRESYRAWRLNPHARGILRTFQKFIIGPGFRLDFADPRRGRWNEDRTRLIPSDRPNDPKLTSLIWDDFVERNAWNRRDKELVLRTFRDGDCLVRRFVAAGRVTIRFVEPEALASPTGRTGGTITLTPDGGGPAREVPTAIRDGVEVLQDDVETVVRYWIDGTGVPADEILHVKCLADENDPRGIPLLEAVLRPLAAYRRWEESRIVLNEVRTAIALVRKVEGSSAQAAALIATRASGRTHPEGREPQTAAGRRETMMRYGTTLTAPPGVSYEFLSPKLDARDAGEDGRRILLSIAAGVGLPEMLVTASWENANYSSTVEARGPLVREVEDWQDFFEAPFRRIWGWVLDAAVATLGLPADTDRGVTFGWPPIVAKDAPRETERNAVLHAAGVLSPQTWAAREDLDWEAEQDHMRAEAEAAAPPPPPPEATAAAEARARGVNRALLRQADLEALLDGDPRPEALREGVTAYTEAITALLLGEQDGGGRAPASVQTLIFDATAFTVAQARAWARDHGFRADKVDETEGSVRLRQADPGRFVAGSMRTIRLRAGVQAVVGRRRRAAAEAREARAAAESAREAVRGLAGSQAGELAAIRAALVDSEARLAARLAAPRRRRVTLEHDPATGAVRGATAVEESEGG